MNTLKSLKKDLYSVNIFTSAHNINPNKNKIFKKHPYLINKIINVTGFLKGEEISLKERLFCILNENTSQPVCKKCNQFIRLKKNINEYPDYCSKKCSANSDSTVKKRIDTTNQRYNCDHFSQLPVERKKQSEKKLSLTNEEKVNQLKKRIHTCYEKYNCSNPMFNQNIIEKRIKTNNNRYGVDFASQNNKVKEKISNNHARKLKGNINSKIYLKDENSSKSLTQISKELNISISAVSSRFKQYNIEPKHHYTSLPQQEIYNFIRSIYNNHIELNNRKILCNKREIDIFIPEFNIGIEVNGVYWHSELNGKKRSYHINKTIECDNKNVQLIHIFDKEWTTQQEIVKSRLNHILNNITTKIHARECSIKIIKGKDVNEFFNQNHIQGNAPASFCLGLIYQNELVAAMSFCKSRFNKNFEYELLRFATKINTTVIGGASRLLHHSIKNLKTNNIISYSDKRWSVGNLYQKLGFKFIQTSSPNYWYFLKSNSNHLYHRAGFQKHKLSKKLQIFNSNISEWDNMKNNGYDRIWDCGNDVWGLSL